MEAFLYNHKTAQRIAVMRNRLLPAVGITPRISGQDWHLPWDDALSPGPELSPEGDGSASDPGERPKSSSCSLQEVR